jgi:Fe-S cluster assembly protein SufD
MRTMRQSFDNAVPEIQRAYERFSSDDSPMHWLKPVQEQAMAVFARSGFPTTHDERWKYTDLTEAAARTVSYLHRTATASTRDASPDVLARLPENPGGATLCFLDGAFRQDLSSTLTEDAGILIEPLSASSPQYRGEVVEHLERYADIDSHQLAALNTAFLTDGLFIRTAAGRDAGLHVQVVFAFTDIGVSVQPRLLVVLEAGSRLTLTEYHTGSGQGLTNAVTQMHCKAGATLRYHKIQVADPSAHHLAAQYVTLDRDSRFDAVHVELGGSLARNDLHVRLAAPGAEACLHGLFVVDGERHADNQTSLDHAAPHTVSRETYRGIVDGRGRGVFNGKIVVRDGADKTDAQLSNRNLLLSRAAEIDTKPELEIYADDVKCAHGATTGELDANALFYLQSRGVSAAAARGMLITAFAREIVDVIDCPRLRDHVELQLDQRLPGDTRSPPK